VSRVIVMMMMPHGASSAPNVRAAALRDKVRPRKAGRR